MSAWPACRGPGTLSKRTYKCRLVTLAYCQKASPASSAKKRTAQCAAVFLSCSTHSDCDTGAPAFAADVGFVGGSEGHGAVLASELSITAALAIALLAIGHSIRRKRCG